eukprot:scaffold8050_cov116-Cylindrotheca_fusiformis.AAC.6
MSRLKREDIRDSYKEETRRKKEKGRLPTAEGRSPNQKPRHALALPQVKPTSSGVQKRTNGEEEQNQRLSSSTPSTMGDQKKSGRRTVSSRNAKLKELRPSNHGGGGEQIEEEHIDATSSISESSSTEFPGAVRVSATGESHIVQPMADEEEDDDDYDYYYGEMVGLPTAVQAEMIANDDCEENLRANAAKDAEQHFLANLTTAKEYEPPENGGNTRRTSRYWIYGIAIVVVVVGIIAAVVAISNATGTKEESPSPATLAPTTSIVVDPRDSADRCENAIKLATAGPPSEVVGTTIHATRDDLLETCHSVKRNGIGVWYYLEGTGSRISLSTCEGSNFDTQLSVFSGSCNGPGLKCEYGNDQRTNCGRDASQLLFFAKRGVRYYVLVHGVRSAVGSFTLTVQQLPANDECATAQQFEGIQKDGVDEVTVFGTNRLSTINNAPPACGDLWSPGPGSWFMFTAKETAFVQVKVDDFVSNLVSVYSGDDCGALTCIATSEGHVMWTAMENSKYYVLVHGKGSSVGDFALTLMPGGMSFVDRGNLTRNDKCSVAWPLDSDYLPFQSQVSISGYTGDGRVAIVPSCGSFVHSDSKGLWYSFIGSDTLVTISTCDKRNDFDTRVSVFTGTCNSLRCVDAVDNDCGGGHGLVKVFAEQDSEFFVLVHGTDGDVGVFNLSVDADGDQLVTASRDTSCAEAVPVILDGNSIFGTLIGAQVQDVGFCRGIDLAAPATFYEVIGTGRSMMASTCNQLSDTGAQIQIYGGSCGSFECVMDQTVVNCGSEMSVVWNSGLNQTYYIQVYGSGNRTFSLNVGEIEDSYLCENTSKTLEVGTTVLGSTMLAHSRGSGSCLPAGDSVGVWYQVVGGRTRTLSLSACSATTNFNAQILVYKGCEAQECLASNDGTSCGDESTVSWTALAGETFYVLIYGAGENEFGNFALALGPGNDLCDTAETIEPDNSVRLGSTSDATMTTGRLSCFQSGINVDGPAVWYKVIGRGGLLEATTCTADTDFDTVLSVYEGSCSNLSCIVANDNSCGSGSSLTWFASEEETYYILVHGFETGTFGLTVNMVENDSCETSLTLSTDSSVTLNKTSTESTAQPPCGLFDNGTQVQFWYEVVGIGGEIGVDACAGSSPATQVSVFEAECRNLSCGDLTMGDCSLSFFSALKQEYHILVTETVGRSLELSLNSSNDKCESAFGPLEVGDSARGSTFGSSLDSAEVCDPIKERGVGVWYYFIGTGLPVTAFTCDSFTDFNTQISVYTGSDCSRLECVKARDDNCGLQSWALIPTVEGETYYVLISGKGESSGNFVLSLR